MSTREYVYTRLEERKNFNECQLRLLMSINRAAEPSRILFANIDSKAQMKNKHRKHSLTRSECEESGRWRH